MSSGVVHRLGYMVLIHGSGVRLPAPESFFLSFFIIFKYYFGMVISYFIRDNNNILFEFMQWEKRYDKLLIFYVNFVYRPKSRRKKRFFIYQFLINNVFFSVNTISKNI